MDKNVAFSYLIEKFKDWYCELRSDNNYEKRFTKLFLLKILFLVAAIKNEEGDLLDIFDNFHALPYGPVESDIYNMMTQDSIPNYTITDRNIIIKNNTEELNLSKSDKELLNSSLNTLRAKNERLITLSPFDLVQITHKWESWDKAFKYAKFTGTRSAKMSSCWIREDKISYFGN